MKRIIASIEKVLSNPKGNRTIRQDVVKRAIERGEFAWMECAFHLTDDYIWDNVNNHGRKLNVSAETMLREYSMLRPSCWVNRKIIKGIEYYEISICFHSNLSYDMYVPLEVA